MRLGRRLPSSIGSSLAVALRCWFPLDIARSGLVRPGACLRNAPGRSVGIRFDRERGTEAPRALSSYRMWRMGGFCLAGRTRNIFRTRRSHPETGIAHYT